MFAWEYGAIVISDQGVVTQIWPDGNSYTSSESPGQAQIADLSNQAGADGWEGQWGALAGDGSFSIAFKRKTDQIIS